MLHNVRCSTANDMCHVLHLYMDFLQKLGSAFSVVFDGYDEDLSVSTTTHEHERHASKTTNLVAKHRLDFGRQQLGLQQPFLANTTNKNNVITLLGQYLTDMGVRCTKHLGMRTHWLCRWPWKRHWMVRCMCVSWLRTQTFLCFCCIIGSNAWMFSSCLRPRKAMVEKKLTTSV